ncbi:Hypothetical protein SMAX5B_001418 [Scophthalmus maximus]|uniref:Uncharacterized protein n=1 Tax=Scophthalmus maximus TaxID=52904 RepID=A0A2U9B6W4_SCOMX|nr:Hypothetical protein SMAX5B_001418 [Scophthalmus maximus]
MAQEEESALQDTRSGFISIKKKEKQKKDEGMKTQSSSGYRRVSDECDLRRLDGGADEEPMSVSLLHVIASCWEMNSSHDSCTGHVMFFYAHDMSGDAELNVVVSVMSRHHK